VTNRCETRHGRSRSPDGPTRPKASIAKASALAASVLSFAATITWTVELATRPPCPPGYVRLVDLDPAARVMSGMLVLVSVGVLLSSLRYRRVRALAVLGLVLFVLALADSAMATVALVYDHSGSASNCWTF